MQQDSFVIRGDICYCETPQSLRLCPDSWLVCLEGHSAGVFPALPEQYAGLPVLDCAGSLVTPGLTDLHAHAPQYALCGQGMDLELLDWLNRYIFPEESRYASLDYADQAYRRFVEDVRRGPNTRVCVFATVHWLATIRLMDLLEESGLCAMVGKVNMDRNCPDTIREASAAASAGRTRDWLEGIEGRYRRTRPILTPRFIPSCTDALLGELGKIQRQYGLPVQSHLSENRGEIAWVRELCPGAKSYGDAYHAFGLFGGPACPTIMAHCVYSEGEEAELLKERNVFIAHCPASNTNLSSGIAPVRRFLRDGLRVGLGSDVAGGTHVSVFRAMADAIQVSKLRWRLVDQSLAPLTVREAFYLGTLGGGAFFGKVGSFAPGYEFDALVIDDARYTPQRRMELKTRLERTVYLSDDRDIRHKFVQGRKIV
ncbi:MAG: amidohydrolase family protein [Oscillospiraceae bacterium]|jgi:guanine deaminase|nr:amidohydrolase family protein [Oscillospiraceae bacterium]